MSFSHSSFGRDLPPHPRSDSFGMGHGSANPPVGFGRTGQGSNQVSNFDMGSTYNMDPQQSHNVMSSNSSQSMPPSFWPESRSPVPSAQPARASDQAHRVLASFGLSSSDLDELNRIPEDNLTDENFPGIIQHFKRKRSENMDMPNYGDEHSRDSLRPPSQVRPARKTRWDTGPPSVNPAVDHSQDGGSRELSYHERLDVGNTLRDRERFRDDCLSEPPFRKSESDYNHMGYSSLQERPVTDKSRGIPSARNIDDFHGRVPNDFPHICSLCDVPQNSFQHWDEHISGRLHERQCQQLLNSFPEWNAHEVGADPHIMHQSSNPSPGILGRPPPLMQIDVSNSRPGGFRVHQGNEHMPGPRQMSNRQAKTLKDTMEPKPREIAKSCDLCFCPLPENWSKSHCKPCFDKGMANAVSATKGFMEAIQKRKESTLEAFKAICESEVTTSNEATPCQSFPNKGIESVAPKDSDVPGSRFKFPIEEHPALLKAIFSTMNIESDSLYTEEGLEGVSRSFPMHECLKEIIAREWRKPERNLFLTRTLKSRFPVEEEDVAPWAKCPRLHAPLADLSLEIERTLERPMDRKAEAMLIKAWEASSFLFKPAISADCVSRNLAIWLNNLKNRLINDTPKEEILDFLAIIDSAVNFLTDAAVETVRVNARVTALINSARRALWLNTWSGDLSYKRKLCEMPCGGQLMFGFELQSLLASSEEEKKRLALAKNARGKGRSFTGRAGLDPEDQQSRQAQYDK